MNVPTVALVGRPNVGKSSLFNRITRAKISVVEKFPGVTRDRIARVIKHEAGFFEIMDTGGLGFSDEPVLTDAVNQQIRLAVDDSDFILFVLDASEGLNALDREVAAVLRKSGKPMLLLANKMDTKGARTNWNDFFSLGLGEPLSVSANSGKGVSEMLSALAEKMTFADSYEHTDPREVCRIAVVGKRNAGKSSFVNKTLGHDRLIVSEHPGTTRDAVDVMIKGNGLEFILTDTAGLRRKKSMETSVEFFSSCRTERSVRKADVVIFLISADTPISRVDKKIGGMIFDYYKPCVIGINKMDLVEEAGPDEYARYIGRELPGLKQAPLSFLSALEGENIWGTLELAVDLLNQADVRVQTPKLNKLLEDCQKVNPPPFISNKRPKLMYGVQTGNRPPEFTIFGKQLDRVKERYIRYLKNRIRDEFNCAEIPIKVLLRENAEEGKEKS